MQDSFVIPETSCTDNFVNWLPENNRLEFIIFGIFWICFVNPFPFHFENKWLEISISSYNALVYFQFAVMKWSNEKYNFWWIVPFKYSNDTICDRDKSIL